MRTILFKKNAHLGFAAESELKNLLKCGKVNQEQLLNLKREALVFVRTCIEKVAERNFHCSLQFWSELPKGDGYKKSWFAKEESQKSYSSVPNCDFKNH